MGDKKLDLDDILGEYSDKTKKSSSLDLDDLDISFKDDGAAEKKDMSDIDDLLGFGTSKSAAPAVTEEKTVHKNVPADVGTSEKTQQRVSAAKEDLKKNFGGTEEVKIAERKPAGKVSDNKQGEKKAKPSAASEKKKSKKKKKKKSRFNGSIFGGVILVTIILTVSMLLAVGGITVGMEYYGIGKNDNDISFNIPEGSTNEEIADMLVENGIIKNKKLFMLAIKIHKPETIFPGDITLQPSMGYADIINNLAVMRESYESVTITITEGETLLDVANKLEENGVCEASDFLFEFNRNQNYSFESKIKNNENSFYAREGYFFPDTYEFYIGDRASNITRIVREHFESKLTEKMYTRMDKLGLDLNEVMTLASIVQLESENIDEMPTVASVFLNRLDDPDTFPMLQSDTTSNYIKNVIAKQSDNESTTEHYTEYYDTYQCKGLPAGPICNPGLDAIMAVLYPDDSDYYYFCNNLETGETFYAKTLEEHEENLVKAGLAEEKKD